MKRKPVEAEPVGQAVEVLGQPLGVNRRPLGVVHDQGEVSPPFAEGQSPGGLFRLRLAKDVHEGWAEADCPLCVLGLRVRQEDGVADTRLMSQLLGDLLEGGS
jgi:hypothetical protein